MNKIEKILAEYYHRPGMDDDMKHHGVALEIIGHIKKTINSEILIKGEKEYIDEGGIENIMKKLDE